MVEILEELDILGIGTVCPNCGGRQFSISSPPVHLRPDLPLGVLGFADCRSCQREFMVKLAPELFNAFASMFGDIPNIGREVLKKLFPNFRI